MHTLRASVLVGVMVASWPNAVMAQEVAKTTSSVPHRFFDFQNIALTGLESGASLADGVYTQRALTDFPELFHEADPIARPFVMRGWPGQIAGGALFVSADVGLRYLLHRNHHHRIERVLPLVLTVYGAVGAIHGARELNRAESRR